VSFQPDPCAYACLSQPGPPSLFAQVIMEQNELFYATFPEARRADEERRQERSQLLTKYWQKLEYYGLPMHFGSPFFPRDIGEEGWYHDPGHVEYPADESYSSFASFSTTVMTKSALSWYRLMLFGVGCPCWSIAFAGFSWRYVSGGIEYLQSSISTARYLPIAGERRPSFCGKYPITRLI